MKKTKKDEKMPDTRDIRISVDELQLIINQLRDSGNDEIDFVHDMLQSVLDNSDSDELNDLTA
jgi:hypothetical protein